MCDPVTLSIMAIASTAASVIGQVQSAKSQAAAIQAQATEAATEAASKASAETNDRLREARREQSRIKVAAGESGLQLGGSIDQLLRDSQLQSSMAAGRIQDNQGRENNATSAEANSMLSRVTSPTLLGAGLQIAGAGVQGYGAGQSIQASRPRPAVQKAAA